MAHGKSQRQSVAIALGEARKSKLRKGSRSKPKSTS
jgi:hypothetical protein